MSRSIFVLALLALISVAFAENTEETAERSYYYPKCPCKCFIYPKEKNALWQCKKKKFLYHCKVEACKIKKKYGYYPYYKYYYGKWCCDGPKPSKSPTPSPSPKPKCPCKCTNQYDAAAKCEHLPYCKVTQCPKYHYYHGTVTYKCCDRYDYH